jgi:hypothetical protein
VKTIQRQEGQASHETHADGELRDSHRKKVRRDPNMNSGGSAPADVGGEPPNGRAKGQRASSRNRMCRGPLKRRSIRPSSRMPTTRQRAGFETGTHSRSPLQGAITRGAPHVPPKDDREGRQTANHKNQEKGTLRTQSPDVCRLTASQRKNERS